MNGSEVKDDKDIKNDISDIKDIKENNEIHFTKKRQENQDTKEHKHKAFKDVINNEGDKEENVPKILLMGKANVGKTSMRSIIFANCAPRDTFVIGYTHDVNESRIKFMGNMKLIVDCGGQDQFIKNYLESKREQIFSNVEVLVFVLEGEKEDKKDNIEDLNYFEECVKALGEYSKNARIFVLVHKMDLIEKSRRQKIFEIRKKEIEDRSKNYQVKCFATSIWEISLYKAWTEIASTLITNKDKLKNSLDKLGEACNAEEVILFEKSTFLVTCHYSHNLLTDEQRFEEISHIIKKFKLSIVSNSSQIETMVIRTKDFTVYLDEFTKGTYLMIILNDKSVNQQLLKLNIDLSRNSFEEIIGSR